MTAVIRPTWTPESDEQRQLLVEAIRRARRARREEQAMWAAILRARLADVPDAALCDQTGQSRSTLNRRYGSRADTTVAWTGDNFEEIQALRPDARLTAAGDLEVERADGPGTWVPVGLYEVVHRREQD